MGQIIVRNLDDAVIERLKQMASREGISVEETARRLLAKGVGPTPDELIAEAKRIGAMSPPLTKPPFGWQLIREDRDNR